MRVIIGYLQKGQLCFTGSLDGEHKVFRRVGGLLMLPSYGIIYNS